MIHKKGKSDLIKIKDLCSLKTLQGIDWEKIFANHAFDKELEPQNSTIKTKETIFVNSK
jgi:hypothetical protein